jgi:RHS repeat-associated protein
MTSVVTSPEGRTTTTAVAYLDGERVETTSSSGQTADRVRRFNWRGELVEDQRVTADGSVYSSVSYGHDDRGNLASVQDANGDVVTYSYDGRGNRLTRTSDPGDGPVTERWEYNAADQVTLAADQLGRETTYTYDAAGRLAVVTDPSGRTRDHSYRDDGLVESILYDDGTDTVEVAFGYDSAGRRTSAEVVGGAGATSYEFDDVYGGLTGVTYPGGDEVAVEYDLAGRRSAVTYPDGDQTVYTYDSYGRLASVVDDGLGTTSYTWDSDGLLLEQAMPGGQYRRWARDPDTGWVELYDTVIDDIRRTTALGHDPFGRQWIDWTDGEVTTYGYDPADQLTSVRHSDSVFDFSVTGDDVAYAYDGVGNRVRRVQGPPGAGSGTVEEYGFDAANQLVSMTSTKGSVAFDYDLAGRLVGYGDDLDEDGVIDPTAGSRVEVGYDPRGLPVESTTVEGASTVTEARTYDATGVLVGQEFSGPFDLGLGFVWDPSTGVPQVVESTAVVGANSFATRYVFGGGVVPGGAAYRLGGAAGAGGVILATDVAGSVLATGGSVNYARAVDYDEWGAAVGPDPNPNPDWLPALGYRGEFSGAASIHLRARDYLPAVGVFTTPDPLDGIDGSATVANRYPYANNNPVNLTDPLGLRASDCSLTAQRWPADRYSEEGDGTVVGVHGDVGCARYVAIFVPGTGTTSGNFGSFDELARDLYEDGSRVVGRDALATVAWLGYDAPDGFWDARDTDEGQAGGESLAADLEYLSARQTVSVVTHSYGSLVAGYAITAQGAVFDNVITLASPGFGPHLGSEAALGGARVWAGLADGDPITGWYLGNFWHGTDPHGSDFDGACRFSAGDNAGHGLSNGDGTGYLDRRTDAYRNVVAIITGQYSLVEAHDDDPDCP